MGTTRSYDDQDHFGSLADFGRRLRDELGIAPPNDRAMLAALQKLFDVPWPFTGDVKGEPASPGNTPFLRT